MSAGLAHTWWRCPTWLRWTKLEAKAWLKRGCWLPTPNGPPKGAGGSSPRSLLLRVCGIFWGNWQNLGFVDVSAIFKALLVDLIAVVFSLKKSHDDLQPLVSSLVIQVHYIMETRPSWGWESRKVTDYEISQTKHFIVGIIPAYRLTAPTYAWVTYWESVVFKEAWGVHYD